MVGNLPGIRIGATLNMEADDPTLGADTYRCRIEDFSGDRLTLTWPSKRGQSVKLAVEDSVSLAMAQSGSDGQPTATIYLDCVVVDRLPPSPGNPGCLAHLQKRGHRLAVSEIKPLPVWEEFSDPGKPTGRQSLNFPDGPDPRSRVC